MYGVLASQTQPPFACLPVTMGEAMVPLQSQMTLHANPDPACDDPLYLV